MSDDPFPWENRVVQDSTGWWCAETWNPMVQRWERWTDNARWPPEQEAAALDCIAFENAEQMARNNTVATRLTEARPLAN